jgi:two-component system sensor histidine kinase GlrK
MAPQDSSPRAALRFPRSFLGLLVTGFLLVAAPLVGALLYSAWHTQRLAEQAPQRGVNAAQAARGSRAWSTASARSRRVAQQVAVLPDPALVEDYARLHKAFAS